MTGFVKKPPAQVIPIRPVAPSAPEIPNPGSPGLTPGTGATPSKESAAPSVQQPPIPSFSLAVHYVLENEDGVNWDHDHGEYTNDPRDPGGRTIWGIIQTEYEDYLGKPLSEEDIKGMPRETALAIYKKKFWDAIHGDSYSSQAAATAIMDIAVNKGLGGCMVILTDALHQHYEARYGVALIAAVNAQPPGAFLTLLEAATERYIQARIAKYPNMAWAQKGWMNRSERMLSLVP